MTQANCILKVALPTPLRSLFDYLSPMQSGNVEFKAGMRVKVPFGKHSLTGFIVGITDHSDVPPNKLKAAQKLLDDKPVIDPDMMSLYRWCSRYYQHPLGETLSTALPTLLHKGENYQPRQETLYQLTETFTALPADQIKRAPKQAEIIALVKQHPEGLGDHVIKTLGLSSSALKALLDKGWLSKTLIDVKPPVASKQLLAQSPFELNSEQQHAVTAINAAAGQFNSFLLEGVTGSGKTEVYLHCIEHILKQGQAALVLVPEIGLTPQTVARFKQRFNVPVAVLHSGLTDTQRLHDWMAAANGHSPIIIGTRSAIFTPIKNLGLIIVDEEHDLSFKQHEGLRYHARDVAVMRASNNNTPIVLGSATPSLESLHNCSTSRYQLLTIKERAGGAKPPRFELIDIRSRPLEEGFSQPLLRLMKTHLEAGNQVLVFLNRRGFAPTLMCHNCSWMANCQRCESRYTLHLNPHQLRCHHCDSQRPVPSVCPDCGHTDLNSIGVGTERSEHFIRSAFPNTEIMRVDRDSTRRKNALSDMLKKIHEGEPCILVGTQMLAKGHHFPNVTLVAILEADGGFFSADFRGLERMSQLITQVGGRAGRASKPGTVAIQTHQADHPLLTTLVQQGYSVLSQQLLEEREQAQLPPYQHAVLLRAEAVTENMPFDFLQQARELAEQLHNAQNSSEALEIFGPIPAVMFKRAGRYRVQLMIQSQHRKTLQRMLSQLCPQLEKLKIARKVRWSIDVDPQESF
ncbi:MAG: primosomal protein N' [Pseudomonadales bacterium]